MQGAATTKNYFLFFIAAGLLYLMVSTVSGRLFARIERWARRGQQLVRGGGI